MLQFAVIKALNKAKEDDKNLGVREIEDTNSVILEDNEDEGQRVFEIPDVEHMDNSYTKSWPRWEDRGDKIEHNQQGRSIARVWRTNSQTGKVIK